MEVSSDSLKEEDLNHFGPRCATVSLGAAVVKCLVGWIEREVQFQAMPSVIGLSAESVLDARQSIQSSSIKLSYRTISSSIFPVSSTIEAIKHNEAQSWTEIDWVQFARKIEQPFFYLSTTTKQTDKFLIKKVKWKQYQFVLLMSTFF